MSTVNIIATSETSYLLQILFNIFQLNNFRKTVGFIKEFGIFYCILFYLSRVKGVHT